MRVSPIMIYYGQETGSWADRYDDGGTEMPRAMINTENLRSLKRWRPLAPGDTIDLVAPGFSSVPEDVEAALEIVREWGFVPRLSKRAFQKDLLCAAPDGERFADLARALTAKDSAAVWCLRGGYGSLRLLPRLRRLRAPACAKLFVGLSDITSLHLFLNQAWGWATVHGPVLERLGKKTLPGSCVKEMRELVVGRARAVMFKGLRPLNKIALGTGSSRAREISGLVTGGNLITLQSSLGTELEWRTRGRILFIEDIGERAYRVDRVLEQFRQAGMLSGIKAIVIGDFTGGKDPDGVDRVPDVIKRFAETVSVPVVSGLKSGHGPVQRPVPFGTPAKLKLVSGRAELVVHSGVC